MSKKIIFATLMVSLPLILNAKVLTVTGIYIGSECIFYIQLIKNQNS